jgi:hypothetical protein
MEREAEIILKQLIWEGPISTSFHPEVLQLMERKKKLLSNNQLGGVSIKPFFSTFVAQAPAKIS